MDCNRLERECAKLDPIEERGLADLGLAAELDEWPEYYAVAGKDRAE